MPIIRSKTAGNFKGLTDTPNDYTGESGKYLVVNPTETGISFSTSSISAANVLIPNVPCLASTYEGSFVYLDSGGTAINAIATGLSTSNVIGTIETKISSTLCNIRVLGVTGSIYTGLDTTKEYFLSDTIAGGITTTAPSTPGHILLKIGQPFSSTEMMILKGQRIIRT